MMVVVSIVGVNIKVGVHCKNESDEEDWRIDVDDNVECDEIDDTLSDNNDEPLRNRHRVSRKH